MASEIQLKEAFNKLKFIECSIKGQNHWFEVLDPTWDFEKYDYRIPSSYSKAISSMMDDQIKRLTDF